MVSLYIYDRKKGQRFWDNMKGPTKWINRQEAWRWQSGSYIWRLRYIGKMFLYYFIVFWLNKSTTTKDPRMIYMCPRFCHMLNHYPFNLPSPTPFWLRCLDQLSYTSISFMKFLLFFMNNKYQVTFIFDNKSFSLFYRRSD